MVSLLEKLLSTELVTVLALDKENFVGGSLFFYYVIVGWRVLFCPCRCICIISSSRMQDEVIVDGVSHSALKKVFL